MYVSLSAGMNVHICVELEYVHICVLICVFVHMYVICKRVYSCVYFVLECVFMYICRWLGAGLLRLHGCRTRLAVVWRWATDICEYICAHYGTYVNMHVCVLGHACMLLHIYLHLCIHLYPYFIFTYFYFMYYFACFYCQMCIYVYFTTFCNTVLMLLIVVGQ